MIHLSSSDLHLIIVISREASFSAAAIRLTVAKSTISERLIRIEHAVGFKLFHRDATKKLTVAGEKVFAYATLVLQQNALLKNELNAIDNLAPTLKIMCNTSLMIDDLPLVLEVIQRKHPAIRFELIENNFNAIITAVQSGSIDAGLLVSDHHIPGLRFIPYRTVSLSLLVPISHELAHSKGAIDLRKAAPFPFIGNTAENYLFTYIENATRVEGFNLSIVTRVSSFEAQAHLVAETSIGIALLATNVATRFAAKYADKVKLIPITNKWARGQMYLCVQEKETISAIAREFIQLLIQRYTSPQN